MADPTCIVEECGKPVDARGLCSACYHRARRANTLDAIALPSYRSTAVVNVDLESMTCDCPRCGDGVRLRVRTGPRGRYSCRRCSRGKRQSETPDGRRLRKYGLTSEEFQIRLAAQGGRCLICKEHMDVPCVDHCHDLGHVRGILCRSCNVGLGWFRDRPELLRNAARYIANYKAPQN